MGELLILILRVCVYLRCFITRRKRDNPEDWPVKGQPILSKIYGFFNADVNLETDEGPSNHHRAVDENDDQEDADLEVELINLDYNFRPINSPPYHGYPYPTQGSSTLPRQSQVQQQQFNPRDRRNSTGSDRRTRVPQINTSGRTTTAGVSSATMAGLSDYHQRSRGAPGFTIGGGPAYSYYDQGDGGAIPPEDLGGIVHPPPTARVPSRAGGGAEYYGGNRATSPYNLQGHGISYSPRLPSHGSYPAGFVSGGDSYSSEGGHSSRPSTRNFNLSFHSPPGISPTESPEDQTYQSVAAKGAGLVAIVAENLLSHPFLVLKRQCQVHTQSRRYHLFPLTMINPVFHICQRQGIAVLWKGLGSTLVVRGMALAVEDVTSKVTPWPKEISRHSTLKAFMQHMLLKTLSVAVITPFYSASLVETVQSDVASETAGFFDVFREGFWRLLSWPSTGRLVPLHVLIVPTVAHGVLSYLIYTGVKSASVSTIRRVRESKERKQGALSRDMNLSYYTELTASLIGNMAADIILFPLETILNRLHLQGTRTIIDSLENGFEVTPILTSYGGVLDCLRTTVDEEGFSGLYKGFGALILQYGLQILFIRAVKIVLENAPFGGSAASNTQPSGVQDKPVVPGYVTPPLYQPRAEASVSRQTPLDTSSRRTPPSRNWSMNEGAADFIDNNEVRYRSRFSNISPVTHH